MPRKKLDNLCGLSELCGEILFGNDIGSFTVSIVI